MRERADSQDPPGHRGGSHAALRPKPDEEMTAFSAIPEPAGCVQRRTHIGMHERAFALALIALFCTAEIISVDTSPRRQNGGYLKSSQDSPPDQDVCDVDMSLT